MSSAITGSAILKTGPDCFGIWTTQLYPRGFHFQTKYQGMGW